LKNRPLFKILKAALWVFFGLVINVGAHGQSCDGADGFFPPLSGNTVIANGDICANTAVIPYRWNITYTNVDDGGNPNNVEFFIDWDDGTTQTVTQGAGDNFIQQTGANAYAANVTHFFPVSGANVLCEYVPTVSLQVAGTLCPSSQQNPAPVVRWNTDDQNPGVLELSEQATSVVLYQICAGDPQTIRFVDRSIFNCVPSNFPGFPPDTRMRWFQFVYGSPVNTITSATGMDINTNTGTNPDGFGIVNLGTGASYTSGIAAVASPITGPTEISFDISVPADAAAGQEFHITLRNWNYCNPYESGGIPTGNNPVETTAIIQIINSPPPPSDPSTDFCVNDPISLTSTGTGGTITWYSDVALTNVVHTGSAFDPVNDPPLAYQVDNTVSGGPYTFYATETLGVNNCEGPARAVTFTIFDNPTASNAGPNQIICVGSATLAGNTPVIGTGLWTKVSGPGTITTPSSPSSGVTGITSGATTVFQWAITNGPCTSSSTVSITRNPVPTTANAGADISLCTGTSVMLGGNTPTSGTGTWTEVSGIGGVTFIPDANTPNATANGLVAGNTYTFRWTISQPSCTDSWDEVDIYNFLDPPADAGPDIDVCTATTNLSGVAPLMGTGAWTINPVGPTITNVNDPASAISGLVAGTTYTLTWTVTNGVCSDADNMVLTRSNPPSVADAGTDQLGLCSTAATMAAIAPVSGMGTWSVVSGSGTFANVNDPATMVTGLGTGINIFQWDVSNACGSTSAQVTIENANPTTSNAGPNQNVCVATATLAGNGAGFGETGTWTEITATGATIVSPNSENSMVTGLIQGMTATFQWAIDNGSCPVSASTVDITYDQNPTPSNAGPDQNVCASSTNLAGNTPTVGTGLWTLISGSGSITAPSNPASTVTGLVAGASAVFEWTISNGTCLSSSSQVTITRDLPPTTANAGTDQNVCVSSTTLAGNTPLVGTGVWTLISGTGTITTPSSPTSTVTGLVQGTSATFEWRISNGTCADSFDEVVIIYDQNPTVAAAGPDQTICTSSTALAANTPAVGAGYWTISGPGIISTPTNPNTTVTGLIQGTSTTFTWTISNGSCLDSQDDVIITYANDPTTANAGPDQLICGTTTNLVANTPTVGTGTWTFFNNPGGTGVITDPLDPISQFDGVAGNSYELTWTIANAPCLSSSDNVIITLNDPIPALTILGSTQVCSGDIETYVIQSADPLTYNYNWDISGLPPSTTVIGGTGSPLQFISLQFNQAFSGTLSVQAENKTSLCTGTPVAYAIDGSLAPDMLLASSDPDLIICEGETVTFTATDLNGTATDYQFSLNGSIVQSGASNTYTTSTLPAINSVTVTGIDGSGVCSSVASAPIVHTVNPLPTVYNITGGGSYCSGGSGVAIGLNASEAGVTYELYLNGVATGIAITPGAAGAFDFPLQTISGDYTVYALNPFNCGRFMNGTKTISIDPLPIVYDVTGGGSYCSGSSGVSIGLSNSETGIKYQLLRNGNPYGAPIDGMSTVIDFGMQTAIGTYTVIATNPLTLCTSMMNGSADVTITALPIADITNSAPEICSGENTDIFLSANIPGTTFTWTVAADDPLLTGAADEATPQPVGSIITQVLANSDVAVHSVTYTVTPIGPGPDNCSGTPLNVQVKVHPTPGAQISGSVIVCDGSTANLEFDFSNGSLPYSAVYTDGISNYNLFDLPAQFFLPVTPSSTTTYSLVSAQDANGCTATVSGSATVEVLSPVSDFSTAQSLSGCSPLDITFDNNNIKAGVQYIWNWGDGTPRDTTTSEIQITHTFTNNSTNVALTYTITMTAIDNSITPACTDISSVSVSIPPTVLIDVEPDASEGCGPLPVSFVNRSRGVTQHRWYYVVTGTTQQVDIGTSSTLDYTFENTTTQTIQYEVFYQGSNSSCSDMMSYIITVYPEITPAFDVLPATTVVITDTPHFTVQNTTLNKNAWSYIWDWGDGTTSTNTDPGNHTYANYGNYVISVLVSNPNITFDCTQELQVPVTVTPVLPVIDFTWDPSEGCRPLVVNFTNTSFSADTSTYKWQFIDASTGQVAGTSSSVNPVFTFFDPGIYTVILEGSNSFGLSVTERKESIITVYDLPEASFNVRPALIYLPNQALYTSNLSTGADSYLWDFGDGNTSNEFEPLYYYQTPGTYTITLTATSGFGCADTLSKENIVMAKEGGDVITPNAFTPSLDGPNGGSPGAGTYNDVFLPKTEGVTDFKMQIFDRWGNLIFESNDKGIGWDGYNKQGKLLPQGVYVFHVIMTLSDGSRREKIGDVTLIR